MGLWTSVLYSGPLVSLHRLWEAKPTSLRSEGSWRCYSAGSHLPRGEPHTQLPTWCQVALPEKKEKRADQKQGQLAPWPLNLNQAQMCCEESATTESLHPYCPTDFFFNIYSSFLKYFLKFLFILFIDFWLHWVFVAARGLSLVEVSRGYPSLWCTGFSLWWLLLLQSMSSRCAGFSSCGTRAQ